MPRLNSAGQDDYQLLRTSIAPVVMFKCINRWSCKSANNRPKVNSRDQSELEAARKREIERDDAV